MVLGAVVWVYLHAVYPLVPTAFIEMSHRSDSEALTFDTLSILDPIKTPLEYLFVVLSHGDPVAMLPQDWPLQCSRAHIWGRCWGMPTQDPRSGSGC